ncbi:hypothetical protein ACVIIV_005767 [Bradyrhizobium sp. USDA 4354]
MSDSLKEDLSERAGAVPQSVREGADTLKDEFADAGAQYAGRVQQAGRDALDANREENKTIVCRSKKTLHRLVAGNVFTV